MQRTRMQTPEDVLAYLPYLLGFHPTQSLIVLGLRSAAGCSQVTFTLRMEIPEQDASDTMVAGGASWLGATIQRHRAAAAVLVAYSSSPGATARFARAILDELTVRQVGVRDAIRADGRRWWPITDEQGAVDDGVSYDVSNHPLVVEAVVQGKAVFPDEQAARDSIAPVDGAERAGIRSTTERVISEFAEHHPGVPNWPDGPTAQVDPVVGTGAQFAVDLVRQVLNNPSSRLDDREIAWLGIYLRHLEVRDEVWALMQRSTAALHVQVWRTVARRCDPTLMVAPFTLLAFAAWLSGDGVLARHAVDVARAADPGYIMARLVSELLTTATPRSLWTPHRPSRVR